MNMFMVNFDDKKTLKEIWPVEMDVEILCKDLTNMLFGKVQSCIGSIFMSKDELNRL